MAYVVKEPETNVSGAAVMDFIAKQVTIVFFGLSEEKLKRYFSLIFRWYDIYIGGSIQENPASGIYKLHSQECFRQDTQERSNQNGHFKALERSGTFVYYINLLYFPFLVCCCLLLYIKK